MAFDLGTRLQLLIGPTVPLPASYDVVDALRTLEIRTSDSGQDGFQLTLSIGGDTLMGSNLLTFGTFEPLTRVVVLVLHQGRPSVLIDGLVTDQQVVPSNRPGESQLHVTGVGISLRLDLEEKDRQWSNRADFMIVTEILAEYLQYGLVPTVTPTTDFPVETLRVPSQQGTDLRYIQSLARRNGFVFYLEPTPIPGVITAYWGPENRVGLPQPALTMNMGPFTNVDEPIHFRYDALRGTAPQVTVTDPILGLRIPISLPSFTTVPLAARPSPALRTTLPRDTAGATTSQALSRGLSEVASGADAVVATGQVGLDRYGAILKPRSLVGVRGVGFDYDGIWYTRAVTYHIEEGRFDQSFTLIREGRGSLVPVVLP
jgi:hypothetical protein